MFSRFDPPPPSVIREFKFGVFCKSSLKFVGFRLTIYLRAKLEKLVSIKKHSLVTKTSVPFTKEEKLKFTIKIIFSGLVKYDSL